MTPREHTKNTKRRLYILCGMALLALAAVLLLFTRPKSAATTAEMPAADKAAAASAHTTARTAAATAPAASAPEATPQATPEAPARSTYEAVLDCDTDNAVIHGQLRLTYRNDTGATLYELVLRLWPNAIASGCLKVETVSQNGEEVYYALREQDSVLSTPFNVELQNGDSVVLYMTYTLTVPELSDRFGRGDSGIWLGGALPIAAPVRNGAWRIDPYVDMGDSFVSDTADYRVVVRCPAAYTVAATGDVAEASIGDDNIYEGLYKAENVREFALALTKNAFVEEARTPSGVTVYGYATFRDRARFLADTGAAALTYFSDHIAPYPYATFSLVAGDLKGGMEYPTLAMIDTTVLTKQQSKGELYIAHEAAHQWFYGVVGSDQVLTPWVDEALAEYLAWDYVRAVHGQTYMEQLMEARYAGMADTPLRLRMDASLAEFGAVGGNEYMFNVYGRGAQLYGALYESLGAEKFYAALTSLYEAHAFGSIEGDDLIAAFSEAAGKDMRPLFEDYMAQPEAASDSAAW